MEQSTGIEAVKAHVEKLRQLLADPHPGLSTWCACYGREMQWLSDHWDGKQAADALSSELKRANN